MLNVGVSRPALTPIANKCSSETMAPSVPALLRDPGERAGLPGRPSGRSP